MLDKHKDKISRKLIWSMLNQTVIDMYDEPIENPHETLWDLGMDSLDVWDMETRLGKLIFGDDPVNYETLFEEHMDINGHTKMIEISETIYNSLIKLGYQPEDN